MCSDQTFPARTCRCNSAFVILDLSVVSFYLPVASCPLQDALEPRHPACAPLAKHLRPVLDRALDVGMPSFPGAIISGGKCRWLCTSAQWGEAIVSRVLGRAKLNF
jgi:hypothetical protein